MTLAGLLIVVVIGCAPSHAPCVRTAGRIVSWCRDAAPPRDGTFERRLANGQLVERASYANGKLHGAYAAWHDNGKPWIEATYEAGLPHGRWLERDYDGTPMFEGTYVRGRLHGAWKAWRQDGSLRGAGDSIAGKLDGKVTAFRPDGTRVEQDWRANRVHGRIVIYDATGAVTKTFQYRDGVEVKDAGSP